MTHDTNIPQGYKATELGIIPQEWEVMRLGDIVSITSGESPSLYHLKAEGKYPYVKVEDLNNCEKYQESCREYSDDNNTTIKAGSIIFPKRGASILNNKVRIAAKDIQMDSNMMAITPHTAIVDTEFLYIHILHERLYRIADTSSIPQINNKHIIPYKIAVPPLAEQRKIAEVLGVWDEAIEKQARLIEKLALRKRALMQRLLSAKLRLPGFSEPWKIHKLQELFTERNETNRTDLPLLSITGDRGVILQTESEKRDTSNDDKSKYKRIAKGDIGYNTMRMWQGRSALSGLEGIVSPAYTIVVPNTTDVDGYYMSVLFKQPRLVYDFWTHSQGLVGDTLNCKYRDFGQVHICCPPLAEQKAITEVLTAADREIELAKEKLKRLRRQKRGLMQQLLTGKKRVKYNEL